ncbi:unnamed protein product [Meganyctiphanes norvegica]|uniref:carbonic anhydrase n=1 Tax=Meganyctiphanes norvegica TaxID=48144 RepID=A0AAV2RAR3_MEGNR
MDDSNSAPTEDAHEFHWSYKGEGGPENWVLHFPIGGLDHQSPIDIIPGECVPLEATSSSCGRSNADGVESFKFLLYDENPLNIEIENNGHTATIHWNNATKSSVTDVVKPFVDKVVKPLVTHVANKPCVTNAVKPFVDNVAKPFVNNVVKPLVTKVAKPCVTKGGLDSSYILAQFHFHWGSDSSKGSEHLIDGKAAPIELHLVHYRADYGSLGEAVKDGDCLAVAVLAVMYKIGEKNAALKPIVDALPEVLDAGTKHVIDYTMDLSGFLPANRDSFYRYSGSLTTPGCKEVVVWTIFKEPLELSEEQLEGFRRLHDAEGDHLEDNFRPVQDLHGRTIYEYDG